MISGFFFGKLKLKITSSYTPTNYWNMEDILWQYIIMVCKSKPTWHVFPVCSVVHPFWVNCVLWMDFKIVNPIPNWSWHLHLRCLQVVVKIFLWLRWNKCLRIQSLIAPMSYLQLFNALEEYNVINTHNSVFKVKFWRHAHTPWMEPCHYEYGVATSLCSAL